MKLALHGATGRMGRAVARLAQDAPDVTLVGAICAAQEDDGLDLGELCGLGTLGVVTTHDLGSGLLGADVVIDFSIAGAVPRLAATAAHHGLALVVGTTNLTEAGIRALDEAAERVPVLWSPNMSVGVQVLAELVRDAIRRLGPGYDVEIVETHHRNKVDAPSGTAKRLASAAREARPELRELGAREGHLGPRRDDELGVFALRGGDVIGDHTVYLLGPGERIELTHRATHRDLFAHGAIRAARFLVGKPARRYTIGDVLA